MPWDITIVNASDANKPLGKRDDIIMRFAAALPGISLEQPPRPPPEILERMPKIIRENIIRPKLSASFEADNVSIQFYTNDEPLIQSVGAEIRGNGNPIPILAALCIPNSWNALNAADSGLIDLSADNSLAWEQFRLWRDKAIRLLVR